MAPPRRFDHDEARRLYAIGEAGIPALAERFGVSYNAMARVCIDSYRIREVDGRRQRSKQPCVTGCGRLCWHTTQTHGRCRACASEAARTAKHGTESRYDRGCRCDACRTAASTARRVRRHRVGVPA